MAAMMLLTGVPAPDGGAVVCRVSHEGGRLSWSDGGRVLGGLSLSGTDVRVVEGVARAHGGVLADGVLSASGVGVGEWRALVSECSAYARARFPRARGVSACEGFRARFLGSASRVMADFPNALGLLADS